MLMAPIILPETGHNHDPASFYRDLGKPTIIFAECDNFATKIPSVELLLILKISVNVALRPQTIA